MKTERSDFGKTKVLSPTESNVKIERIIYFKHKNMLHNISELSSGAVRSKFNILYVLWLLHYYKEGEERSEGPDAQCKGNTRFIIIYKGEKKKTIHENTNQHTTRNNKKGKLNWRATPLVGYTLW